MKNLDFGELFLVFIILFVGFIIGLVFLLFILGIGVDLYLYFHCWGLPISN